MKSLGLPGLEQHSHITLRCFKKQHQYIFNRMMFFQATVCEIVISYLKPMQFPHSTGFPNSQAQELSQSEKKVTKKILINSLNCYRQR